MNDSIDFWFSIGSTYSYLSVMRLEEVSRREGVHFRWRPFNVRAIMKEMNNIPFGNKPVKATYMWRDIERRAQMYRVPLKVPAPYPLHELELANAIAVIGSQEGWCSDYVQATYRRWFQLGQEPGIEPNLSESLREVGQDPNGVIEKAKSPATTSALAAVTEEARGLQIFGAPTFIVAGERFWGDDRLEDAIRWFRHGSLQA
jgi:2-hydroxychromene-2-carboxylate isomerase